MGGFLDTTAMVDLLFKDKSVADRVRTTLSALGPKYTSQYVRMEIKRGVLQNFGSG
jgi:predicted nucleic acid-binding protein